jgi:choline dehydrogenase-like flavoprotein
MLDRDPQNCDAILQRCLGGLANSEFDWGISTVPQAALGANNSVQRLYLGKALGGTSLLNGMMFDRGSPSDIDAWEELGNPGWNWKGLLPYYKKVCICPRSCASCSHVC